MLVWPSLTPAELFPILVYIPRQDVQRRIAKLIPDCEIRALKESVEVRDVTGEGAFPVEGQAISLQDCFVVAKVVEQRGIAACCAIGAVDREARILAALPEAFASGEEVLRLLCETVQMALARGCNMLRQALSGDAMESREAFEVRFKEVCPEGKEGLDR
jgi:hypothetical protein